MTGYTKLFGSILDSSIWQESKETKLLWITMLAMCGKEGIVEAAIPGLAHRAGLTMQETEQSLTSLSSPDPYSRTKDNEGRRIEAVDGGWRILNHGVYRDRLSKVDKAEYMRQYRQDGRDKSRSGKQMVNNGKLGNQNVTPVRHADAESDADSKAIKQKTKTPSALVVEFPDNLKTEEFKKAWGLWESHRKEIRKPLTPTSVKMQLDRLSKMGVNEAISIISQTIAKGWQGLKDHSATTTATPVNRQRWQIQTEISAIEDRIVMLKKSDGMQQGPDGWEGKLSPENLATVKKLRVDIANLQKEFDHALS